MEVESRSYNPGPIFRPKPFVLNRPEAKTLVITTSWTTQSDAERISQMILEQIEQTPREDLTSLHDKTNPVDDSASRLRMALSAVSLAVFKTENFKQARLLLETMVIQVVGSSVVWAQVGQPSLYVIRKGRVAPLAVQADHSILQPGLPPLPRAGLGLESETRITQGSMHLLADDRLLLLAQTWGGLWPHWDERPTFQKVSADLIESQPDIAFWCGLVTPEKLFGTIDPRWLGLIKPKLRDLQIWKSKSHFCS